jgi:DNA-binding transcriptional MerR regulator
MPETLPVFPHPHPRTGEPIVPLGYRRNGAPIWPCMGAAPDDDENQGKDDDGKDDGADEGKDGSDEGKDDGDDDEGKDDLGDKGKQAIDRMKGKLTTTRAELREFKALGLSPADIKKIVDAKKDDGKSDELDADKIREEARREARAEAAKERVEDKIEARAAKKFADADDAVAILLRTHDINDFLDGDKVDAEAISEALDELLEAKPHLAAAQGGTKKFGGGADGGARKASRPKQLTRDDLSRMKPEEIVKAKADGRLDDVLKGK